MVKPDFNLVQNILRIKIVVICFNISKTLSEYDMFTSIPHPLDEGCIMTNIFVLYHIKGSTFHAHFHSNIFQS